MISHVQSVPVIPDSPYKQSTYTHAPVQQHAPGNQVSFAM